MYNFKRLINKYSKYNKIVYINKLDSEIDMENGGVVIDRTEEAEIKGAIINTKETIRYDTGGYGKEDVMKLYTYNNLPHGSKIIVEDKDEYTVFEDVDRSRFDTGLFTYRLESGE